MKGFRAKVIIVLFLIFSAIIVYRLACIQIINHDYYKALAHGQQGRFNSIWGERGSILFKDGQILAGNIIGKKAFFASQEPELINQAADNLADVFEIEKEEILKRAEENPFFIFLKNNLTDREIEKLKNQSIPGLYIEEEKKRSYPQDELASHVIGFLGGENIGQYGIEGFYDEVLRGKEALEKRGVLGYGGDLDGATLVLTLDYNIQFMAERLLEKASQDLKIEAGSIIVINPKTGGLLAMANFPNFDPNNYREVNDFSAFKNSVVHGLFEPGSVLKAITMASALDKGSVDPETKYTDKGYVQIGGYTLKNYAERVYGEVNMIEVLEKSINTGAVFAVQQMGNEPLTEYFERFGFFRPTGIDLQGEAFSENIEYKKGYEVNYATASFGHGIKITPIQLIRAFTAFANSGKMVQPYFVDKAIQNGGAKVFKPALSEEAVSAKAASQITSMLVSVVENGFSKKARIPGYYIAGKTGTSQIPWSSLGINKKGYSDKTWQSFVGYAPAFNPEFLILVKLDNPRARTAEYSAMPIFHELAKYIIGYLQIPPDYEIEQ